MGDKSLEDEVVAPAPPLQITNVEGHNVTTVGRSPKGQGWEPGDKSLGEATGVDNSTTQNLK